MLTGDGGRVGGARGVLPISDPTLLDAVTAMETAWDCVACVESSTVIDADRRALLVRMETMSRAMYGASHEWLTSLIAEDGLAVLPERTNPSRLACLLRIDPGVAGKRIKIAAKLAPRIAMTGEVLEPEYPTAAAAQRAGEVDAAHVTVIDEFFKALPSKIALAERVHAELVLSNLAKDLLPEQLRVAAHRLHALLDPDGSLADDKDPANECFFHLGRQGRNGLSKGRCLVDAEFRGYIEALLAKLAKAGECNANEPKPVVDDDFTNDTDDSTNGADDADGGDGGKGGDNGPTLFDKDDGSDDVSGDSGGEDPRDDDDDDDDDDGGEEGGSGGGGGDRHGGSGGGDGGGGSSGGDDGSDTGGADSGPGSSVRDERKAEDEKRRAGRDVRSQGLRNHDALKAVLRAMLASGSLGQHRGLPVTAVITMTLQDLRDASGHAVTGTGSLVSIRDAIRMASHAHQYLAVFDDDGRALYLGRSKRLASADQRIVLIARDRGCTFPGCTRPATWCQAHHVTDWEHGGDTDIDSLTFACDRHHPLVGEGTDDWATTITGRGHRYPGRAQWHPPAAVDPDRGGMVNHYHHPQEYLFEDPDTPGDADAPDTPKDPDEPEDSGASAGSDAPEDSGAEL